MTEWDLIQTFVIVAESKDLTEAAQKLGVTQAAVSQRLTRLEKAWKLPLFFSVGRKRRLKPWNQEFAFALKPILREAEFRIEQALKNWVDPTKIRLRIGARREVLSAIAEKFNFPGIIELIPCDEQRALDLLQNFQLDVAIMSKSPSVPGLISHQLFEDHSIAICPSKWSESNVASLAKERPYISFSDDLIFVREALQGLHFDIKSLRVSTTVEDWELVIALVRQGKGWSIVPSRLLGGVQGVRKLPLKGASQVRTKYFLAYQRHSRKILWFRKYVIENIPHLIRQKV
jgi:LysR family carnitine catabolism transcriptional activator